MLCTSAAVVCALLALSTQASGEKEPETHAAINHEPKTNEDKTHEAITHEGKTPTIKNATLGDHPYMGYLYYPEVMNHTIIFHRGAILVSLSFLVTSALDTGMNGTFPKHTLMARVGAVTVKGGQENDTIDTDEDVTDQEIEVIQVIHPKERDLDKALFSDIAVVKVLTPFTISAYVNVTTLNPSPRFYTDEDCYMLIYYKINENELRLQKRDLKGKGPSTCTALQTYNKERMLCSMNPSDEPAPITNDGSCLMHAGGPFFCDKQVAAIQSYKQNQKCIPPYTFMRIRFWDNFIKCALEGKCDDQCENVCIFIDKDKPEPTANTTSTTSKTTASVTSKTTVSVTSNTTASVPLNKTAENTMTVEDAGSSSEGNETDSETSDDEKVVVPKVLKVINGTVLVSRSRSEVNAKAYAILIVFCLVFH